MHNKTTGQLSVQKPLASPKLQSTPIGYMDKEEHINVEFAPSISRSADLGGGSGYTPLYWVERIYQGLRDGMYQRATDGFQGIIKHATATGLTEAQKKDILRYLAAVGLHVDDEKQEISIQSEGFVKKEARFNSDPFSLRTGKIVFAVQEHFRTQRAIKQIEKYLPQWKKNAEARSVQAAKEATDTKKKQAQRVAKAVAGNTKEAVSLYRYLKAQPNDYVGPGGRFGALDQTKVTIAKKMYSPDARKLQAKGWTVEEIADHFKKEAQTVIQNPTTQQPTTPAGNNKKWVWDAKQGSWVSVLNTSLPGVTPTP